jgi:hypothetical protein
MLSRAAYATCLLLLGASSVGSQTAWDPHAVPFEGAPAWQQAAVAALNRHLPTDSGYWVLGPLDLGVDLPDTLDLVRTTLRIIAPDLRGSRSVTQRLWMPTGGVALEELQPSDTLPHELPPGYPGRFLKGTIVGEYALVQVLTVQAHRWLLWAHRTDVSAIREAVSGSLARYSTAVGEYFAAMDSGFAAASPPRAAAFGLDPTFDLYAEPPAAVVRDRDGYLALLDEHRALTLAGVVTDVYGFVPSPALMGRLEAQADGVLFVNREGERALQRRYRDFLETGSTWSGRPVLTSETISGLPAGRYSFAVDRYGLLRVGPAGSAGAASSGPVASTAILAHGDPVLVAGQLTLSASPGKPPEITELNVNSEDYFFSNRSLSLYEDVEVRSDRYVAALGHALRALDLARIPRGNILIRKF